MIVVIVIINITISRIIIVIIISGCVMSVCSIHDTNATLLIIRIRPLLTITIPLSRAHRDWPRGLRRGPRRAQVK